MAQFDSKFFNSEVFLKYIERIPNTKRNELLKCGVLKENKELITSLAEQTGGNYIVKPFKGLISGGTALNYDGKTDITASTSKTYKQGMVVVGRAAAFTEKDFSTDLTSTDFMGDVAAQVSSFFDEVDQKTLVAILRGLFEIDLFNNAKSLNLQDKCTATSLNDCIQKASGDNKGIYKVVVMNSVVATNLENENLLSYIKYTDDKGIQRDTNLATWNGRLVFIDDSATYQGVPATYKLTEDTAFVRGKSYYKKDGEDYIKVLRPNLAEIKTYYEQVTPQYDFYHTYILGEGAFEYANVGVKTPYELDRDPKVNGGETTLYARQRKVFAPNGFTFKVENIASDSPTDEELMNPNNWDIVRSADGTEKYPLKAIPICRITSKG